MNLDPECGLQPSQLSATHNAERLQKEAKKSITVPEKKIALKIDLSWRQSNNHDYGTSERCQAAWRRYAMTTEQIHIPLLGYSYVLSATNDYHGNGEANGSGFSKSQSRCHVRRQLV